MFVIFYIQIVISGVKKHQVTKTASKSNSIVESLRPKYLNLLRR